MSEEEKNKAYQEIVILKMLSHSNIIKINKFFGKRQKLFIKMEYAEGTL